MKLISGKLNDAGFQTEIYELNAHQHQYQEPIASI